MRSMKCLIRREKKLKYNKNKLMDQVDTEIRNISIVTAWDIMTGLTNMNYNQKIERIEEIIRMYRNDSRN